MGKGAGMVDGRFQGIIDTLSELEHDIEKERNATREANHGLVNDIDMLARQLGGARTLITALQASKAALAEERDSACRMLEAARKEVEQLQHQLAKG